MATRGEGIAKIEGAIRGEKFSQNVRVVKGGDTRQESVAAALKEVAADTELVLVHDAVRPFVKKEQITMGPYLSAVEVAPTTPTRAIIAFGDSITDGYQSTIGPNGKDEKLPAAATPHRR